MAGRIRGEDIAEVRARTPLDELVGEFVSLRPAGSGSLKGLCPFHEERTPSFHVTPSRGVWHCFGCGEGGDVFAFLQRIESLGFVEAVERLAARASITLRTEDGSSRTEDDRGLRSRLLAAHRDAEAFYRAQLETPEARIGVQFLRDRGFVAADAERFGIGYAPSGWDGLVRHLTAAGHAPDDLVAGGLAAIGSKGTPYDRFRGRLTWPIRNASGETIGFGARRLVDDDSPKYLNTPETVLYKKSQVLYGIDLARRDIARRKSAIVVEGYTDVMACHLAGLTTAVAACGTAFGDEHVAILRRLLIDDDSLTGEVTFTFDGDAAGQKAALRAFASDQRFTARTYVAIAPDGMDPCEVRQGRGDAAVRELIAARVPLFEFAIRSAIAGFDLSLPLGRADALAAAAPLVRQIKDPALRPEYARMLAGWIGIDVSDAMRAIARGPADRPASLPAKPARPDAPPCEREALKAALQRPSDAATWYVNVEPTAYTAPEYLAIHQAICAAGITRAADGPAWTDAVLAELADEPARGLARELSVEPLPSEDPGYPGAAIARLMEHDALRQIADARSRAQRCEDPDERRALLTGILALEAFRRDLADAANR